MRLNGALIYGKKNWCLEATQRGQWTQSGMPVFYVAVAGTAMQVDAPRRAGTSTSRRQVATTTASASLAT